MKAKTIDWWEKYSTDELPAEQQAHMDSISQEMKNNKDKNLEIMFLKAKYESEGIDISHIDWDLAIEYEKKYSPVIHEVAGKI